MLNRSVNFISSFKLMMSKLKGRLNLLPLSPWVLFASLQGVWYTREHCRCIGFNAPRHDVFIVLARLRLNYVNSL